MINNKGNFSILNDLVHFKCNDFIYQAICIFLALFLNMSPSANSYLQVNNISKEPDE